MNNPDNVLNLLVEPDSGNIYHVSSLAKSYFGLTAEQLRGMNFSRIFRQPLREIVAVVAQAGYLKEVTLHMHEPVTPATATAYASLMQIDNRAMLFLCVYGLQASTPVNHCAA